jgi:hypothetical protein
MLRMFLLLFPLSILPAQVSTLTRAILEGDVVNAADNSPLAGARIKLDQEQNEPLYTRADRQGHFIFWNLAPGSYRLSVDSPGFLQANPYGVDLTIPRPTPGGGVLRSVTTYPTSHIPNPTVTKSTDADGTLHAKATVPLMAYAVITGTLTDPYGVPMVDCEVEILTEKQSPPAGIPPPPFPSATIGNTQMVYYRLTRSDGRGEFRFARLEPGTYWVVATTNSGGVRSTWESSFRGTYYPAATDPALAKPLKLAAGQHARADIQIVRQAGVRVAGRLVKPAGHETNSRMYTQVVLMPEQSAVLNGNRPFANGQDDFELKDVTPGRYILMAQTSDARDNPFDPPKAVFGYMRPIEVGDKNMNELDLMLEPLRDLPGVVTFSNGCTPTPLRIQVQGSTFGPGQVETTPGTDGKFVLTGLTAGKHTVFVGSPSSPGLRVPVSSVKLGNRDVMKDGFEVPYAGNEMLRIAIDCAAPGRVR